jgi:hypothetical protein
VGEGERCFDRLSTNGVGPRGDRCCRSGYGPIADHRTNHLSDRHASIVRPQADLDLGVHTAHCGAGWLWQVGVHDAADIGYHRHGSVCPIVATRTERQLTTQKPPYRYSSDSGYNRGRHRAAFRERPAGRMAYASAITSAIKSLRLSLPIIVLGRVRRTTTSSTRSCLPSWGLSQSRSASPVMSEPSSSVT